MATPIDPGAILKLREDTISEIYVIIEAAWQLAALAVNPWPPSDAPEAMKLYTQVVANGFRDIAQNMMVLFTDSFPATHNLLYTLLTTVLGDFGKTAAADYDALLQTLLKDWQANLVTNKTIDPTQAASAVATAMEGASALGVGSRLVTMLFEIFIPKRLNFMNWLGPTLAQFSGYEETAGIYRGAQLHHALGNVSEYNAAATFRTVAPPHFIAAQLRARGLINDEQLARLEGWGGIMTEFAGALASSAYRAVQPRALAQAFVDVNFPVDTVREMMQFAGNRPQDIEIMLEAFAERATQNVRNQYLAAILTASEQGTMTSTDLESALTSLNFSDDAKGFVRLTVATKKLQQLDTLYRKSVSEAYKYGQITDADYVAHLEAIGIADADAEAHFAIDSIAKRGKDALSAARAVAREQAIEQRAAVASARAQYSAGNTDEAGLAAELLAAGLSAPLIAFAVSIAQARRQGSLRLVYGQLLAPPAAEILGREVAAIGEQTIKKLITPDLAIGQLAALNIPGPIREALAAKWAAQADKTILAV